MCPSHLDQSVFTNMAQLVCVASVNVVGMCSYCPSTPFITRRVFYSSHTPLMFTNDSSQLFTNDSSRLFTNDSSRLFTNDQPIVYQRYQPIVYPMSTEPIVYERSLCLHGLLFTSDHYVYRAYCLRTITMSTGPIVYERSLT